MKKSIKLYGGYAAIGASGIKKEIAEKTIEVDDIEKTIKDIMRKRMVKEKRKLTEEDLTDGGMPHLREYRILKKEPMAVVNEVWAEIQSETGAVDMGSLFRISPDSGNPYHIAPKKKEEKAMKKEYTEKQKDQMKKELGKIVKKNNGELPNVKAIKTPEYSYSEFLAAFGNYQSIEIAAKSAYKELLKDGSSRKQNRTFGVGKGSMLDEEMVVKMLAEFYLVNGRLPDLKECKAPELPSISSLYRFVGPKSEWMSRIEPYLMNLRIEEAKLPEKIEGDVKAKTKTKAANPAPEEDKSKNTEEIFINSFGHPMKKSPGVVLQEKISAFISSESDLANLGEITSMLKTFEYEKDYGFSYNGMEVKVTISIKK